MREARKKIQNELAKKELQRYKKMQFKKLNNYLDALKNSVVMQKI